MLYLLQMGTSKVLTTLPLQIQNSWQLSLLELPPCCVPACNTVTSRPDSSGLYTSTVLPGFPSTNAALPPHSRLQTFYPPSAHSVSASSAPSPSPLTPGFPSTPSASSPPALQWNAGGLRARSTELLHFLLSHFVPYLYPGI